MAKPNILIVGAGPAGLFAAQIAAEAGADVRVIDAMPTPARKFLMAGRGGLNLTHSEDRAAFSKRYGSSEARLRPALDAFPPAALRAFVENLGEATFVGSSGRVFPRAMKASPMLRAWIRRLDLLCIKIDSRIRIIDVDSNGVILSDGGRIEADAIILALGGASWPRLGGDGGWAAALSARGVGLAPFRPANCGFDCAWSADFAARFAGTPLKNIALHVGDAAARGEMALTSYGIEGGAVYAVSAALRDAAPGAGLFIDLRPDLTAATLAARLSGGSAKESLSNRLRKRARMRPEETALLREGGALPREADALAARIKRSPIPVIGPRGLDRAISSAGGVMWDGIGPDHQLRALPGVFVAGEMIDWEAPTGGYLLQACFATGRAAACGALAHVGLKPPAPWEGRWDAGD